MVTGDDRRTHQVIDLHFLARKLPQQRCIGSIDQRNRRKQSLAEARSALLEAQQTVTSEVKGVSETVSTEMGSAQRDISGQLSEAEKVVSNETAQVRDTIEKAKQGKTDGDLVEVADSDFSDSADVSDVSDPDISDVERFDEDADAAFGELFGTEDDPG